MRFIGLLMISGEDDVLERTLAANARLVDAFYVLDGSVPNRFSRDVCESFVNCEGYFVDGDLPRPPYSRKPKDGWRQFLYAQAIADFGYDNWFLLLHGDEVWTVDPRDFADETHDGYVMPLPVFFPREGEPWDDLIHPLDQLRWHLGPGYPEFRMFKGGPNVAYDIDQHFNVAPEGVRNVAWVNAPINHYLYRSPDAQRARARKHVQTGFDPDNYAHILAGDEVYWTDQRIRMMQAKPFFRELAYA